MGSVMSRLPYASLAATSGDNANGAGLAQPRAKAILCSLARYLTLNLQILLAASALPTLSFAPFAPPTTVAV